MIRVFFICEVQCVQEVLGCYKLKVCSRFQLMGVEILIKDCVSAFEDHHFARSYLQSFSSLLKVVVLFWCLFDGLVSQRFWQRWQWITRGYVSLALVEVDCEGNRWHISGTSLNFQVRLEDSQFDYVCWAAWFVVDNCQGCSIC